MPVSQDFLRAIKSRNADTRFAAVATAWQQDVESLVPLADAMASADAEVAKSSKQAAEAIVHFAGRPRHTQAAAAASQQLLKIAADTSRPNLVRGQALDWLGLVATDGHVPEIANLLTDADVRDDARMALERIPGDASLNALQSAASSAPSDFRPHLEQSLANRNGRRETIGTTRSFAATQPATQTSS